MQAKMKTFLFLQHASQTMQRYQENFGGTHALYKSVYNTTKVAVSVFTQEGVLKKEEAWHENGLVVGRPLYTAVCAPCRKFCRKWKHQWAAVMLLILTHPIFMLKPSVAILKTRCT